MNKTHILFHLNDARKAIEQLTSNLESKADYGIDEYRVDMQHVYHHLNTAWNGRDADEARTRASAQKDFNIWRQFPKDLEIW
jgi:hypothetical protein